MSVIGLHARNIRAFANEDIEDGASGLICKSELDFVAGWISSSMLESGGDVGIRRSRVCKKRNEREELLNVIKQFVLLLLLSLFLCLFVIVIVSLLWLWRFG